MYEDHAAERHLLARRRHRPSPNRTTTFFFINGKLVTRQFNLERRSAGFDEDKRAGGPSSFLFATNAAHTRVLSPGCRMLLEVNLTPLFPAESHPPRSQSEPDPVLRPTESAPRHGRAGPR